MIFGIHFGKKIHVHLIVCRVSVTRYIYICTLLILWEKLVINDNNVCSRCEWNGERAITDSGNQIWLEMQFPKVWSSLIVKVEFGMKKESFNFYAVKGVAP